MHNFKISERFDVIFSVFDSINFLNTFAQWKLTFQSVNDHLNENGLFIFDIYTLKMLKDDEGKGPTFRKISKGYYYDKGTTKNNTLVWDVKIFEDIGNGLYHVNEYELKEAMYPITKVDSALSKHFEILETKSMEKGRKVLFVCRKK